jgi:hypothetical protein
MKNALVSALKKQETLPDGVYLRTGVPWEEGRGLLLRCLQFGNCWSGKP